MNRSLLVSIGLAAGSLATALAIGRQNVPVLSTPVYRSLDQIDPAIPVGPGYGASSVTDGRPALIVIGAPGYYLLTGSLSVPAGSDGVRIASGGVTLDLRGFSIRGAAGSGDGITMDGVNRANITIRNGTISLMGEDGVDLSRGRNVTVEGVSAAANAFDGIVIDQGQVRQSNARSNGRSGFVHYRSATFTECVATSNSQYGFLTAAIVADGPAERMPAPRESARVTDGTLPTATGAVLRGCVAAQNNLDGFRVGIASIMTECQAQSNAGAGYFLSSDSLLSRSSAVENGSAGIDAGASSIVVDSCMSSVNLVEGVILSAGGVLRQSSVVMRPGQVGVRVAVGIARIEGNTFTGNGTAINLANTRSVAIGNVFGNVLTEVTNASQALVGATVSGTGSLSSSASPWSNLSR